MAKWKLPPKAKIYEGLSAIADKRVKILDSTHAEVLSSDNGKTYNLEWSENCSKIISNDNASYWQGYLGYPIIAVLLITGKINYNEEIALLLAGVPWKTINKKYKNNWDKAVDEVLSNLKESGIDINAINAEVDNIMDQIKELDLERLPSRLRPPK